MFVLRQLPKQIVYRLYKKFNEEECVNDAEHTPFHVWGIFVDEDGQLWYHNKLLDEIIHMHAPHTRRRKAKQQSYMNDELRKAIKWEIYAEQENNKVSNWVNFDR